MTQEADHLAAARREALVLRAALARGTAERRHIQNELRLRNAALDAATTHFMIVDARLPNYPIVYVNRGLATDHGYDDPQSLIGQDVSIFAGTYPSEHDRQQYYRALADGETARVEMEITRPDGHKFLVGFSTSPLRNGLGQVTHYVTLGADITARREAERRKQQLQEQLYAQIEERERMAQELRLAHKLESVGRLAPRGEDQSPRAGDERSCRARPDVNYLAARVRVGEGVLLGVSHGCAVIQRLYFDPAQGRRMRTHVSATLP